MKTLRDAKIGETVKVVKLHGEGACQAPHHGHGHHQGHEVLSARWPLWATRWRSPSAAMS